MALTRHHIRGQRFAMTPAPGGHTTEEQVMGTVFISYSHTDANVADQIAEILEQLDIAYFRDLKDIEWGDAITSSVKDGLTNASAVVVIISPGSLKSHWVSYEVGFATARGTRLLPYLTHPSLDPPGFITDLAYAKDLAQVTEYFTDWNPIDSVEPEQGPQCELMSTFDRLVEMMPELLAEMKEDLTSTANKFIREFVPLDEKGMIFNHGKPRFEYYGDTHDHLMNKIDMLEDSGFIYVVHHAKYSKIYRMTEEFVTFLLNWNNAT